MHRKGGRDHPGLDIRLVGNWRIMTVRSFLAAVREVRLSAQSAGWETFVSLEDAGWSSPSLGLQQPILDGEKVLLDLNLLLFRAVGN